MDKASMTNQAAVKEEAKGKATVQAGNAVANLREAVNAEATTDLESRRSGVSASASAGSKLRGVYDGHRDERLSRSSRESESSRRRHDSSCESEEDESRSRSRNRSSRGDMDNLSNSVRFRGNDLDSAFGPRVFGQPSVQRAGAPSVGGGRLTGGSNSANLRGTQIPSADIQLESNRALGFHLQPDVQLNRNEESACVSAEETHREGCTKGAKYRHFAIKGDIVVSEKVTFKENSVEEEKTAGRAAKNTMAVETTDVGDILRGP
jgi:hypothetical protein